MTKFGSKGNAFYLKMSIILNYKSSSFDNEGWFYTGDLVESCCNGFIRIVGRSSSVINVGGEKVLPIEVEGVLYEMEDVRECRVYGEANPVLGQIVAAEIFPKTLIPQLFQ